MLFTAYRFPHSLLKVSKQAYTFVTYTTLKSKYKRSKMDTEIKCRENPIVFQISSPEFKSIFSKEVCDLKQLFDKYGFEIRIAGGAVRDLLMGMTPKDLDFATTATPQEMKDLFSKEEIRMINSNGEKHGTITARINDKENFEVTTLRIDMVTDGRHAEVTFTTDWKLDANRRDLTINSMFLGFDGSVYDYFFGYEDLLARRVVFVGDSDVRIKEDFLRILRYFRFYGRIAEKPDNHDDTTLQMISQNVNGLERISGERIWTELKKTLDGNFAGDILKTMLHVGTGKYMGLPENPNTTELERLWEIGKTIKLQPMTLLSSLLYTIDDVIALHSRLKTSAYDRDLAFFIVEHRKEILGSKAILTYKKLLLNTHLKPNVAREYIMEVLKYTNQIQLLEEFKDWVVPPFCITGKTLTENGVPVKQLFGDILRRLKDYWADHDFNVPREELEKLIPDMYALAVKDKQNKKK